jgi:hypothetical protein
MYFSVAIYENKSFELLLIAQMSINCSSLKIPTPIHIFLSAFYRLEHSRSQLVTYMLTLNLADNQIYVLSNACCKFYIFKCVCR